MRLSDAGLHRRQTKALYPNHRPTPWPNEDVAPRSLEPIVRPDYAITMAHRCATLNLAASKRNSQSNARSSSPSALIALAASSESIPFRSVIPIEGASESRLRLISWLEHKYLRNW